MKGTKWIELVDLPLVGASDPAIDLKLLFHCLLDKLLQKSVY